MSKKSSELEDRIEELESELEEVKTVNKALMRRLKKTDRTFDEDDYLEDSQIQKKYERLEQYACPTCKKNTMEEVEIAGRSFRKCMNCGKRTKAEKVQ